LVTLTRGKDVCELPPIHSCWGCINDKRHPACPGCPWVLPCVIRAPLNDGVTRIFEAGLSAIWENQDHFPGQQNVQVNRRSAMHRSLLPGPEVGDKATSIFWSRYSSYFSHRPIFIGVVVVRGERISHPYFSQSDVELRRTLYGDGGVAANDFFTTSTVGGDDPTDGWERRLE